MKRLFTMLIFLSLAGCSSGSRWNPLSIFDASDSVEPPFLAELSAGDSLVLYMIQSGLLEPIKWFSLVLFVAAIPAWFLLGRRTGIALAVSAVGLLIGTILLVSVATYLVIPLAIIAVLAMAAVAVFYVGRLFTQRGFRKVCEHHAQLVQGNGDMTGRDVAGLLFAVGQGKKLPPSPVPDEAGD